MKYVCKLCGTVFGEDPQQELCPGCGARKEADSKKEQPIKAIPIWENDDAFLKSMKYAEDHRESER